MTDHNVVDRELAAAGGEFQPHRKRVHLIEAPEDQAAICKPQVCRCCGIMLIPPFAFDMLSDNGVPVATLEKAHADSSRRCSPAWAAERNRRKPGPPMSVEGDRLKGPPLG